MRGRDFQNRRVAQKQDTRHENRDNKYKIKKRSLHDIFGQKMCRVLSKIVGMGMSDYNDLLWTRSHKSYWIKEG